MKNKPTMYLLYRVVDESSYKQIANVKASKEVWDILEKKYKGDNRVKQTRLQTLKSELESKRMKEAERG